MFVWEFAFCLFISYAYKCTWIGRLMKETVLWSKAEYKRTQHCRILHVGSVCTPCCMLLDFVAQSLKSVKLFSQQLPTLLLFCDRRSVAQQCWIRLHSSFNIGGATHADYAWFTKTYGLYPSHYALQVPTLLGVVASVCRPLPIRAQQLPTLLAQQCWDWLANKNAPVCTVLKVWQVSNFAQQHATTSNKMQ